MSHLLFEDDSRIDLLPLTFTRPLFDLGVGITTLREKWSAALGAEPAVVVAPHLSPVERHKPQTGPTFLWNGKFFPTTEWVKSAQAQLAPGEYFALSSGEVLAAHVDLKDLPLEGPLTSDFFSAWVKKDYLGEAPPAIRRPSDLFQQNGRAIRDDFARLTAGRKSAGIPADAQCTVFGAENIFVEEGAVLRGAMLDATDGPIYIGAKANIGLGALIQGAHAICEGATVNMGAKLRGDSTIGPGCKVGGEVSNSILLANSNKGHDGFLGNSVLGEWCNLGADTNTSNLKNNYAEVKLWNYRRDRFDRTGTIFCGLVMGDHAKCGINTMFNTGTVVGVAANVFGDGYPRNFIPDFSWGGAAGLTTFAFDKVMEVAEVVMKRRGQSPSPEQVEVLRHVFEATAKYRVWEKGAV
jgi:UDP-N-acetylglucosamine diphosphorylase/glucosamine-1-phosphate N-acetyltransferase